MTGWDVLDKIIANFSPIAAMVFFLAAGIIFAIGFFRHGVDFVKHGFKQKEVSDLGKKIDNLDARLTEKINGLDTRLTEKINGLDIRLTEKINDLDTRLTEKINGLDARLTERIDGVGNELEAIKVNHFGHLKDYLAELSSILLDKNIINNQDKARLDNQLRGM
jgi:hypothetical protein